MRERVHTGAMVEKPTLITRARAMRKEPSQAERAMWALLRNSQTGVKFRRQHPVESYIADFASVEAKLIVEIDGNSHANDDQRAYDERRTMELEQAGWRVLRFKDADVLS